MRVKTMNHLILAAVLLLNQSYGPKVKADPNNPQPGSIGRKIPNFVLPLPNDKKASVTGGFFVAGEAE